jgi:hypothetical protein
MCPTVISDTRFVVVGQGWAVDGPQMGHDLPRALARNGFEADGFASSENWLQQKTPANADIY